MKLNTKGFALLLVRIVIGVIFFAHGLQKVQGMEMVIPFFQSLGFSAFMAHLVAYTELIGGALLVLGLFTRIASGALAVVMATVLLYVKFGSPLIGGKGIELDLVLFATLVMMMLIGGGALSLGPKMCACCRNKKCTGEKCACHVICDNGACAK